MPKETCFHCGDVCRNQSVFYDEKNFCCTGCKTVYDILSSHDLSGYYDLQQAPGSSPKSTSGKFDYLENKDILEELLDFQDTELQIVSLYIPNIHCSSCIWILENLHRLRPEILSTQVDFPKKNIQITYKTAGFGLKNVVQLLTSIGYEPYISLDDFDKPKKTLDRSLIYKLGVAGFAFGNVMFLSFPEYFEISEFWLDRYKYIFRGLMFAFSLPVVFYAARDYFVSAIKGLRTNTLNIDIPIALGILVLFIRSTVDVLFNYGSGFFDSLTGLVFFLLLGKFFQQKTYSFLSFERDYKSYFPVAVTRLRENKSGLLHEDAIPVYEIKAGDRLLIHHAELLPVDCLLISGEASLDYSFVTGESSEVQKTSGDKLYAGGKQCSGAVEVEALKTVTESKLIQLWGKSVFTETKSATFTTLTNKISKWFTLGILSIAILSGIVWAFIDPDKAANVFTAVLIIACPCALALAAPFALGNILRIFGKHKFYLKDTEVIEKMAQINMLVFDKTGTLTTTQANEITYAGEPLNLTENTLLKNALRASSHPLSRGLYAILADYDIQTPDFYEEFTGQGISCAQAGQTLKIGSTNFTQALTLNDKPETAIHINSNRRYKGRFIFKNSYRKGVSRLLQQLETNYELAIISGDNEGEEKILNELLPSGSKILFNQNPEDKLAFITGEQFHGKKVMMIGDGLNDAGALAQSDVGVAISENVNVFSPACDAILDASRFQDIAAFLAVAKRGVSIVKSSFVLSLCYNCVGLFFAVTGQLSPLIAAILMPLSSISIVLYVTLRTNLASRKLKPESFSL